MIIELIVFGSFIIAAFICGFYFGYLKRENKMPEPPETLQEIGTKIKQYKLKKEDAPIPKSFYD